MSTKIPAVRPTPCVLGFSHFKKHTFRYLPIKPGIPMHSMKCEEPTPFRRTLG